MTVKLYAYAAIGTVVLLLLMWGAWSWSESSKIKELTDKFEKEKTQIAQDFAAKDKAYQEQVNTLRDTARSAIEALQATQKAQGVVRQASNQQRASNTQILQTQLAALNNAEPAILVQTVAKSVGAPLDAFRIGPDRIEVAMNTFKGIAQMALNFEQCKVDKTNLEVQNQSYITENRAQQQTITTLQETALKHDELDKQQWDAEHTKDAQIATQNAQEKQALEKEIKRLRSPWQSFKRIFKSAGIFVPVGIIVGVLL